MPNLKSPATGAWLAAWQGVNGYSDGAAADALGLSVSSFRRQRTGRSRVSAQTALLAVYAPIFRRDWLDIADIATRLARVSPR